MLVKNNMHTLIIPYGMQLVGKLLGSFPLLDKILDSLKLSFRTRFESARVVEYEARVGREYELIFDVVVSTLN